MKMFVHGGDSRGTNFSKDKTSIELFLRFGSDDNNFYEFREPVFEGWEGNEIDIDLNQLAMLKLQPSDSLTGFRADTLENGKQYRVKGEPSLTNIRQLVLGVKNISTSDSKSEYSTKNNLPFLGEIWINELRLSGVKKDKGIAVRARADLQLADVFSINGEINKKDADFHNVNTRFGTGNNEWGGNFSGNLSLHKFLPKSWGFSIPVNFNYSRSEKTPKYLPGSDIMVTSDLPPEKMEEIRTFNESKGFGISFKKNTRSNNFFIKNTIDQISVSYNTARSHGTSSTHEYSDRETHAANVSYSIPFPRDKYIRPFKWLGNSPIIKKIADIQLYYWPSSFSVRASGNRSISQSKTRSGVITDNKQFITSRSLQTGIQPFKSLGFDFSRSYKNDLRNSWEPLKDISNFKFGELTDMDQSFSTKYNPQFFSWLKTNFNYSTNFKFTNNIQLKDRGRSASNNTSFSSSFTFDPDRLVKSIFKPTPSTRTRRSQKRPPAKKTPTEKKEDQQKKEKEEKKPGINPFKVVLGGVQFFTNRIQPINLTITNRNNVSNYGLDPTGGMPSLAYMFGQTNDPGMESVESVGTNTGSLRFSNSISLSSGLKIIKQLDISLKYNFDQNKSETTTKTGDCSESWFYTEKNGGFPLPEWSIRWSGLERIKLRSKSKF